MLRFFSVGIVIFSSSLKQFCARVCVLDAGEMQTVEELHNVCCRAVYPLLQIFIYDNKAICIQVQLAVVWDDGWKYSKDWSVIEFVYAFNLCKQMMLSMILNNLKDSSLLVEKEKNLLSVMLSKLL